MANDEHVAILKKGVTAWNAWRKENRSLSPDLTHANLHGTKLVNADLHWANLQEANLKVAFPSRSDASRLSPRSRTRKARLFRGLRGRVIRGGSAHREGIARYIRLTAPR
jgi:Pentapeptide repeats (8 copies)